VPLGLLVEIVLIAAEDHFARESAGKLGWTTLLHDGKVLRAALRRDSRSPDPAFARQERGEQPEDLRSTYLRADRERWNRASKRAKRWIAFT
jgi:hypothetical protein